MSIAPSPHPRRVASAFAVAVPGGHSKTHAFEGAKLIADSLADPRIYAALGMPTT